MSKKTFRLGELLIQKGYITQKHVEYALQIQKVTQEKLGEVLTRLGIVSDYLLITAVAEQLELPYLDLNREKPEPSILKRFNRTTCLNQHFFPLYLKRDNLLVVTWDVPNQKIESTCIRAVGKKPIFALAEQSKIIDFIYNYFYFLNNPVEEVVLKEAKNIANDIVGTANPDNFINNLLLLAVQKNTTDIHIRPMEKGISFAFRIDGILQSEYFFPTQIKRVISAIKLQAGMDIAEQRLPQDGRWRVKLLNKIYDIRCSSTITPYGENLVMRLLPQEKANLSLEQLGFFEEDVQVLKQIFKEPYGIILLTGPTGSGKSTTLVAGLTTLDLLSKNVLTVEDPIEYLVPLARQTQVNEAAGYTFANAMRYFLRHDPDIILVGEMRDEPTARTAMTAANTGHLVLSTLHANTAIGAIPRLQNLGIDNLTIAGSLLCVVSQRLVRTICKYCREKYQPDPSELNYLGVKNVEFLIKGRGCEKCNFSGYIGRTLVYEILVVDQEVKFLIEQGKPIYEVFQKVKQKGFQNMFDIGVKKVLAGITTTDELKRVIGTTLI